MTYPSSRAQKPGVHVPAKLPRLSPPLLPLHCPQVCVTLPDSLLVPGQCLRLKLELVRGSTLLSTRSLLLLDSQLSTELQELQQWAIHDATPAQVSMFVEDLAEYLSFQGLFAASTPASTVPTNTGSCGSGAEMVKLPEKGLLPVLRTESRRAEMLHMMAEVRPTQEERDGVTYMCSCGCIRELLFRRPVFALRSWIEVKAQNYSLQTVAVTDQSSPRHEL
eukprot:scaffold7664_cov18-Tisochrysis_lutea.AAC.1